MKKQLFTIAALALASFAYAQVGINNTTPQSTLDITAKSTTGATPEGLLIPRVDRARAAAMTGIATSTMIYVNNVTTGTQSGIASNIDTMGFYYYNGLAWVKMGAGSGSGTNIYNADGTLTGNRLVTQGANTLAFTGTAANAFSVDGTTLSVDAANDRVGIGTAAPANKLHITGNAASTFVNVTSNPNLMLMVENTGGGAAIMGLKTTNRSVAIGINPTNAQGAFAMTDATGFDFFTKDFNNGNTYINAFTNDGASGQGNFGVGTNAPASTVDIAAKNATGTTTGVDGLLIPRVDRQRAQSMASVPTSTMIYVNSVGTGGQSGTAANMDTVGFYYFDGTVWQKMGQSSSSVTYQSVRGNVRDVTASAYTVQADDYLIVTRGSATTVTFPALTASAADVGRTVIIFNYNNNSTTGVANTISGVVGSLTGNNGGRALAATWTGSLWVVTSAT